MTTGERTFSTAGRTVVAQTSTPITPGKYKLRIGSDCEIKKADKPDATPYVAVRLEVLGTASTEGGKNRSVYHNLFLMLKPGKDGVINMDRENGLTSLAHALGTQVEGVEIVEQSATNANGESVTLEYLNPRQVVAWLKEFAGTEVSGRIKTEKGTGGYADKSVVSKFLLSDE
jgi:hypothetical protein